MQQSGFYRPDIDGLRAVAVLAVIFFHFGFTGFSGGYVGVDVFFVISGFLITQILVREHELGRYSIVKFYERRVRRIIPALVTVLALTLAGGWFLLAPVEYSDLGKSTLSAVTFISNVKFWRGAGYFDSAGVRPILHTWSLAVEEQFYIVYPVILALLYRFRRNWIGPAIVLALTSSFLLSAVGVFLSPSATFFLIPTRAWELMIGAALALGLVPKFRRPRIAELFAWLGLLMLALSVILYDERTYFPGASALLPCLGTAFLIHSGNDQPTRARAILSWPPIVTVGLMSYSLYLYHFPIHIFAVRILLRELSAVEAIAAIALTFVLAYASWRFVERPFRRRDRFTRRQIFVFGAAGSIAVAIPAAIIASSGLPQRFSSTERNILAAADDFSPQGMQCLNLTVDAARIAPQCQLGLPRTKDDQSYGDFLLVGDSHAAAILPPTSLAASSLGRSGTMVAFNACAPLAGVNAPALSWRDGQACRQRNRQWLALAKDPSVRTVLLAGYWSSHLDVWTRDHGDGARYMARALDRTLNALAGKKIVIFLDVPHSEEPIWIESILARRFGRIQPKLQSGNGDAASQIIRRVAAGRAQVIDLSAPFCRKGVCNAFDANGRPILADRNHVTASVARQTLTPLIAQGLTADARRQSPTITSE